MQFLTSRKPYTPLQSSDIFTFQNHESHLDSCNLQLYPLIFIKTKVRVNLSQTCQRKEKNLVFPGLVQPPYQLQPSSRWCGWTCTVQSLSERHKWVLGSIRRRRWPKSITPLGDEERTFLLLFISPHPSILHCHTNPVDVLHHYICDLWSSSFPPAPASPPHSCLSFSLISS